MADIELVIKIPEEKYLYAKNLVDGGKETNPVVLAIGSGTPLEEHGNLIDVDEALKEWKNVLDCEIDHPKYQCTIREVLEGAQVVIEADKRETPSKTGTSPDKAKEMQSERSEEMKSEYEYKMSVPIFGRLDAHVISETPLTKEEVMQRAFESANFGELEDCDINRETDIDELYFEGEAADEEHGDYE